MLSRNDDVRARIAETIDRLQDIFEETVDDTQSKARYARREIRNHPGISVAAALVSGLAFGLLLGRIR